MASPEGDADSSGRGFPALTCGLVLRRCRDSGLSRMLHAGGPYCRVMHFFRISQFPARDSSQRVPGKTTKALKTPPFLT